MTVSWLSRQQAGVIIELPVVSSLSTRLGSGLARGWGFEPTVVRFNCARLSLDAIQVCTPTTKALLPRSDVGSGQHDSNDERLKTLRLQAGTPKSDQGPATGDHASSAYHVRLRRHETRRQKNSGRLISSAQPKSSSTAHNAGSIAAQLKRQSRTQNRE